MKRNQQHDSALFAWGYDDDVAEAILEKQKRDAEFFTFLRRVFVWAIAIIVFSVCAWVRL